MWGWVWICVRVVLAAWVARAGWVAVPYVLSECITLGLASWNQFAVVRRAHGARGLLVPAWYVLGYFVDVRGEAVAGPWVTLCWCLFFMETAQRVALGRCCSVGRPTWAGLYTGGLYRFMRHPCYLLDGAMRVCLTLALPSGVNWLTCGLYLAGLVAAVCVEERFLETVAEWRAYASRVRWRLVPGVF